MINKLRDILLNEKYEFYQYIYTVCNQESDTSFKIDEENNIRDKERKNIDEIQLLVIDKDSICNIVFSSSILYSDTEHIENLISSNMKENKIISDYYKKIYLKDSVINKEFNYKNKFFPDEKLLIDYQKIVEENNLSVISSEKIKMDYKVIIINSLGVNRHIEFKGEYIEEILKTQNDITLKCGGYISDKKIYNISGYDLNERFNFYNQKFKTINNITGNIKISSYAFSYLIKNLMLIFNYEAINSDMCFIGSKDYKKQILPKYINILDSPQSKQFSEKYFFDSEGLNTKEKYIVKNGIMNELLGDINSWIITDIESYGNCYCNVGKGIEKIPMYKNVIIDINKECIDKQYKFEIIEFSKNTYLNVQTGFICGEIFGYLIEEGAYYPIKCSINTNVFKIFNNIERLSNYVRHGDVICPEVMIFFEESSND